MHVADRSRYNGVLRDEGDLLKNLPNGVEQKETSTGKPWYFWLTYDKVID